MWRPLQVWLSLAVLPGLLSSGCWEKETLLQPQRGAVTPPTDCLMECTGMTYVRKQRLRDDKNIRMRDATEGDGGEHCWSTELKCTVGESFHSAFVVLPVDVAAVGHQHLDVRPADPAAADPATSDPPAAALHPHGGRTAIDDGCGLRYDVTQHFGSHAAGASFCIRVAAQDDALGDAPGDAPGDQLLRCPPYLVTFWRRKQSNQQDGG